jgi:predicted amidohydrolase
MGRQVWIERMRCAILAALVVAVVFGTTGARAADEADTYAGRLLFHESFDDGRLQARGWYDGDRSTISKIGARTGGCIEYDWKAATTTPDGSSGLRRQFAPTDSVYVRFYLKLSPGWSWSGRSYHPHLMHFLTTENGRYHGPAASHLTLYIEPQAGKLRLAAQDIENAHAPHGLTQGPLRGGFNGKFYDSKDVLFTDDVWHCVEAFFRLNSLDLKTDQPRRDGVVRGWFDGRLVVDHTDVVLRSTDFPNMKFNQYLLAPYFGPGLLPHEQSLWIDELTVGQGRGAVAAESGPKASHSSQATRPGPGRGRVRIAAAQPRNRTIDFQLPPAEVINRVDQGLTELEQLVHKAGTKGCDVLVLPEDTLGLLNWATAHPDALGKVLPQAVSMMLERLGPASASHGMYLVVCQDTIEKDGQVYNTSYLIGRDGKEIGRYHKVNLPLGEQNRARGREFPVFRTADLGTVGMLICYDMVFPETARCLALQGADVIFHPTLGGAAIGDDDISLAAFRTRAAENFVYLVVAMRQRGSMIISPQGKIIATADEPDELAVADIDPHGGREGGDAFNTQRDMRGRLFRERVPDAYGILTEKDPPILAAVPSNVTREEAIRIAATVLTTGEARFNEANALARAGQKNAAIQLFEKLCEECRTSWIERAARDRIQSLRAGESPTSRKQK